MSKLREMVLLGRAQDTPKPDVVICVVDANNLERNLYLVSQIQDLGIPMIIALNMMDEIKRRGIAINIEALSRELSVPVVPMVASQNKGIDQIKQVISQGVQANYERKWHMAPDLEEQLEQIVRLLKHHENFSDAEAFSEAMSVLSVGRTLKKETDPAKRFYKEELISQINLIQEDLKKQGLRVRSAAVEARYDWIKSVIRKSVVDHKETGSDLTEKIDSIVTHKFWDGLLFLGLWGLCFI